MYYSQPLEYPQLSNLLLFILHFCNYKMGAKGKGGDIPELATLKRKNQL